MALLEDITAQHRNLLKHPLPRTFLMLKWRKLTNIYKMWITMKSIFLCLFVVLMAKNFGHFVDENQSQQSHNQTVSGTDKILELDTRLSQKKLSSFFPQ